MDASNALGEFLRARRRLVRPEDVGIGISGTRRVEGLRREEVAMLAGISTDYYLRLEQGRDRNPSPQVLNAIARALTLDQAAADHMSGLTRAQGIHASPRTRSRGRAPRSEQVPQSIRELIDGWSGNPAWVQNRFFDVLAANDLASALSPHYAPGVNLLAAAFLDPSERERRIDWELMTRKGVATLRALAGPDVDDPRLTELVGELSLRSDRFRDLWARHDVTPHTGQVSRLRHPQVGDLELRSNKLTIAGSGGLILVVFHPEPGSRNAEVLQMLGNLSASGRTAMGENRDRRTATER
ncbi:helix-turn-helix domain-containing protein [Actinacidiphila glaucinigra]|uniref:helix-turn-helix domain-containing protein n=1 Tax=Actinacidiphila glaucinigra TaxID=235986 RepID=UPI0029A4FA28|nr:helix-turn-helix transcriptional regulator [Streptomyces sp. PA03-3a]